ncbi:uncharacterized protein H6S33_013117 [Morchella sextelata]|uniref:uncharacterized protein n=1 Tax=Morchella sextelata TaxID=1174677 RepID=UPI001D042E08|nr:uncharacterized protein H6S33_013117 [Morchella sextelata]KAH0609631.1 hypothetical protein H6S33_013117 [Morchella sextelata]
MSRISSLGLHTPAALPYCITESLLPDPPPPNSYRFTTGLPHEELLVTGSAVIWSQGGVIRRVFRYDVEKEPVQQAVLTWFSSDDPQDAIHHAHGSSSPDEDGEGKYINGPEGNKRKNQDMPGGGSSKKRVSTWNSKSRTYAAQLGSFPKAHGTVGGGGGMVSTTGDIDDEDFIPGKVRALVVFLKSQAFVYFLSGISHVIHLPFEVERAMPAPHGLILQRKSQILSVASPGPFSPGNSFNSRPTVNTVKDSPTLFSLTDPLLEVGLIVTSSNTPSTEDLIFISPTSELDASATEDTGSRLNNSVNPEVIFAVTRNWERTHITVWNVRYIPQEPPTNAQRRTPSASGTASRRRSSFGPGTGGTTPVSGGGPGSIASTSTIVGNRESLGPSDLASLPDLNDDFDSGGRRGSRRVSSLVARADLSGNHDRPSRFSDVSGSINASFGSQIPTAPYNSMNLDSEQPVDELLNELNMGALGIGMGGLGIYDGEGLRNEVLMSKIESYPFKSSLGEVSGKAGQLPKVFTLHAPSSSTAAAAVGKESGGKKVVLCVMNVEENELLLVTFLLQIHPSIPRGYSRRSSTRYGSVTMGYTPVFANMERKKGVLDAIKMEDHGASRILILTDDGELQLFSPWGPSIRVALPPTLSRWNTNVVGEDGSRRGSRKKGFARNLSTSPDKYEELRHSEIGGRVTVVDGDGVGHRISITMAPRETAIKTCLETSRVILGASAGSPVGEGMWASWIEVGKWLGINTGPEPVVSSRGQSSQQKVPEVDEWKAFVTTLFLLAIPSLPEPKPAGRRKSAGFVRSASLVASKEWEDLVASEGEWGSGPEYLKSPAWSWMVEEEDNRILAQMESTSHTTPKSRSHSTPEMKKMNAFITECISLARDFTKTPMGQAVKDEYYGGDGGLEPLRKTGLAMLLVALHLVREEWKLDVTMEGAGRRLCPVLRQLATWLGWSEWIEEYMLEDVEMSSWKFDETKISSIEVPPQPFKAPSIYDWLIGCLEGTNNGPFMMLQDIVTIPVSSPTGSHYSTASQSRARNPFSPPPMPPPLPTQKRVFARLTPRTRIITELYTTLTTPGSTDVDVVARMVELKMNTTSLERLPEGIAVPLREAVARCQEEPPTTWGAQALDLVGRKDLKMLIDPGKGRKEGGAKWQSAPTHEATRDVHAICNSTFEIEAIGSYDHLAEHDRQAVSRLIFKEDRRTAEAAKLLSSVKPAVAKCIPEQHWTEQDTLNAQKEIAQNVAVRTLSVSPGRGLFNFSSRIPLLTEKFPISAFNLSTVMKPSNTTVSADKVTYSEEKVCWAFFHAGVSAGVSISREAKEIDTSWIVFNKPAELTNRHAGFLLGLGMNGHLKSIAKWHAFNYLTPKHTMVSIGLLLGLSASYLGTMDTTITKLLSVHVTRLLPPGSAELNLSPLTQTAGIMGIGLLYANTQHRRMSEVMLSEIEYVEIVDSCVPSDTLRDEGYRLAAGFALGFINLGSGKDLRGLHDMHLVERLLSLAVGSKKVTAVHILDKATAGATIALALIYMKTNDEGLARKVDVPDTIHLFDYVRPDIFLLRTIARNLIMWDNIQGSFSWIRRSLVPFLRGRYKLNMTDVFELDSEDLPFFNIIAGLCFCIGLKFAGSGDEEVRDVLVHYLDQFIRLCNMPARNHDQKLTRATSRNCQDLIALAASTVMAGTGDVAVFRRLRKLHGRIEPDVTYGSHLAAHLAIGVLFMGNGSFTFGTGNLAVASLLCAFYPLFPNTVMDNKSHLQAFRHMWVLAAEARCLVARDVDTHRPCAIPITITLRNGEELHKSAPCLLPELDRVASVTTASPHHWTVVLDFANNPQHLTSFQNAQTIYVHRRTAHASTSTVFQATLQALDETETNNSSLEWLLGLRAFSSLDKSERALLLPPPIASTEGAGTAAAAGGIQMATFESNIVDTKLVLENDSVSGVNRDRLKGVRLLFAFCERMGEERGLWLTAESVDRLRAGVWTAFSGGDGRGKT